MQFSKIIWLYGMSDAGKTTLGRKLAEDLGFLFVDSDYFRKIHWVRPNFTPNSRYNYQNELRSEISKMQLADSKGIVVASITPYEVMRRKNRRVFGKDYFEVLVKCDLDVLIERDSKGLYKKALNGEIPNFTGISDAFEEGTPDLIINTSELSISESSNTLITGVKQWLSK